MPKAVPADYFSEGVFRAALPGELFNRYTCSGCGHRSKTWEAFRAHRTRGCQEPPATATEDAA